MKFSIIIPTHNRRELLQRVLSTVFEQTYSSSEFEVIVVASPGDSAFETVSQSAEGRSVSVRCVGIYEDPWQGKNASAKRNYGASLARGEWLAFIDDDCEADPRWLEEADLLLKDNVALEGCKKIPVPPKETYTYRGLKSFEKPGGYQSCNMFYRRDVFLKLGGFDLRFPFYLEDTDFAWSVIDNGFQIPHASNAIVRHPVVPAAPWRLLDDSKRTILLPLLKNKHPEIYRQKISRLLQWNHKAYLIMWLLLLVLVIRYNWDGLPMGGLFLFSLTGVDLARRYWGCRVSVNELAVTCLLIPFVPLIRLIQYARGLYRYRHILPTARSIQI
ncbi:glycosyltransferase family 2 protein [Telmatocola sphagniphila]|uniref:glycosyltransferase family 2 protein n=1 Tax=Telmatocola sphagniphila TaxID=1123043 RepID=UPI0021BC84AB|nr:glycosyltransferase family A protein [Telmatocola sphagniphila]